MHDLPNLCRPIWILLRYSSIFTPNANYIVENSHLKWRIPRNAGNPFETHAQRCEIACTHNDSHLAILLWEPFKRRSRNSHFILSTHQDCIMRTAFLLVFTLLPCASFAYSGYTEPLQIDATCAPCSTGEHCATSACWKHRCGTQVMQTLKLCRDHFLDNCQGCLHGEQCMSGICLNNRCGDAKSQYQRRCFGLPKPNCEVCGSHKQCASGWCERKVCVGRSGWDECKIQL